MILSILGKDFGNKKELDIGVPAFEIATVEKIKKTLELVTESKEVHYSGNGNTIDQLISSDNIFIKNIANWINFYKGNEWYSQTDGITVNSDSIKINNKLFVFGKKFSIDVEGIVIFISFFGEDTEHPNYILELVEILEGIK